MFLFHKIQHTWSTGCFGQLLFSDAIWTERIIFSPVLVVDTPWYLAFPLVQSLSVLTTLSHARGRTRYLFSWPISEHGSKYNHASNTFQAFLIQNFKNKRPARGMPSKSQKIEDWVWHCESFLEFELNFESKFFCSSYDSCLDNIFNIQTQNYYILCWVQYKSSVIQAIFDTLNVNHFWCT